MTKKGQLVFIDDSGDPGIKRGVSSQNFVLAAVLFSNADKAALASDAISKYRHSLGWQKEAEFKFRKTNKKIIVQLLKMACACDFEVYVIYTNKVDYVDMCKISLRNKDLYNQATKDLLSLMSLDRATVRIDGKYDKTYRRYMRAYIRRELNNERRKIIDFDAVDSAKENLIQLADLIAGAINRSFQPDKTDANKYMKIIKRKIVVLKNLDLGEDRH